MLYSLRPKQDPRLQTHTPLIKNQSLRTFLFNRVCWLWNAFPPIDLNLSSDTLKVKNKSCLRSFFIKHFSYSLYFSFRVPMCQMYVVTTANQLFMLVVLMCLSLICTDYFKFGALYRLQSCHQWSMSFTQPFTRPHFVYTALYNCSNNNNNNSISNM